MTQNASIPPADNETDFLLNTALDKVFGRAAHAERSQRTSPARSPARPIFRTIRRPKSASPSAHAPQS